MLSLARVPSFVTARIQAIHLPAGGRGSATRWPIASGGKQAYIYQQAAGHDGDAGTPFIGSLELTPLSTETAITNERDKLSRTRKQGLNFLCLSSSRTGTGR